MNRGAKVTGANFNYGETNMMTKAAKTQEELTQINSPFYLDSTEDQIDHINVIQANTHSCSAAANVVPTA